MRETLHAGQTHRAMGLFGYIEAFKHLRRRRAALGHIRSWERSLAYEPTPRADKWDHQIVTIEPSEV